MDTLRGVAGAGRLSIRTGNRSRPGFDEWDVSIGRVVGRDRRLDQAGSQWVVVWYAVVGSCCLLRDSIELCRGIHA